MGRNKKKEGRVELGNEINGVTITLREIYDSVKDLNKSIERMEGNY